MAKDLLPTPHQALTLHLALPSGRIRFHRGGWWIGAEQADFHPENGPPDGLSVTAHSVKACVARGWLTKDTWDVADLTDAGRTALGRFRDEGLELPCREKEASPAP